MFDLTLTFDNGPTDATPHVLDVLSRHAVPATFFAVGRQVEAPGGRALAERVVAEGHWIGSHSHSHLAPFGKLSDPDAAVAELLRGDAAVAGLAHPDRLVRPLSDGGFLDDRVLSRGVLEQLRQGGFSLVLWTSVPRDWEPGDGWVDVALADCATRSWTLMILHDVPGACSDGLERFIRRAVDAGARFRQDFPPECVPLYRGQVRGPVEHLVAEALG